MFRQFECAQRLGIDLAHRGGREDDDRVVAMAAPARLHDVALRRARGHAGRRSAAHHVHDYAGDLRAGRVAQVLLFQRKAGAAGRGQRFDPAHGGADHRGDRGDFVFHLHEYAVYFGQQARQAFGNLGGGRDRVAGEKAAARRNRAERAGVVARDQAQSGLGRGTFSTAFMLWLSTCACATGSRCTRMAKSGHSSSHSLQPVHFSGCASSTTRS